jgi:hypothetical protein
VPGTKSERVEVPAGEVTPLVPAVLDEWAAAVNATAHKEAVVRSMFHSPTLAVVGSDHVELVVVVVCVCVCVGGGGVRGFLFG